MTEHAGNGEAPRRDIVVVGASAGGIETLTRVVAGLPGDLPAAVLVVVHLSPASPNALPEILARAGPLPATTPVDGDPVERGRIAVAPPDRHVLVERGRLRVVRGPRENRHRPAVDPLFRTAALAYGRRVIGVILSGTLDDGAAGLVAVKERGGTAIVQDPEDALHPGMPLSAIAADGPDYVAPAAEIPALLDELVRSPLPAAGKESPVRDELDAEAHYAALDPAALQGEGVSGTVAPSGCPECGGALWELEDDLIRFRCRIGHAYAGESLVLGQSDAADAALWSALRALEERASLCRRIADRLARGGSGEAGTRARRYGAQAEEAEEHAMVIRHLLASRREPVG